MYCFSDQNSTIFVRGTVSTSLLCIHIAMFIINSVVLTSACLMLKKQFNVTYLLLGNLALTDLVPSLAVFAKLMADLLGSNVDCQCLIRISFYNAAVNCSSFTVGFIALDKYFYLIHGLVYHKFATKRNVLIGLCIIWIINIAVGFLPVFGVHNRLTEGSRCLGLIILTYDQTIARTILGLFPILVTVFLYLRVLRLVLSRIKLLHNQSQSGISIIPVGNSDMSLRMFKGSSNTINSTGNKRKNKSSFKKFKVLSIVALTCGSFLITWFPYYVCSWYYQANCLNSDDEGCRRLLANLPAILLKLAYVNSFLNPAVYLWWHKGFRKYIKSTCSKICFKKENNQTPNPDRSKSSSCKTSF